MHNVPKHGSTRKQVNNKEFQEIGSMAAFKVLETQFQMFIKSRIYLDDEYVVMTRNYFLQYTQLEIPKFHDTLIQHMESIKKLIDKRALHKREYDSWVNERQMQTTEEKDTSSRSGNDAYADDADIRPIYDEEPMAEEAKKKTQESGRNSRPSVMPSTRSQSTVNGSKPKLRINNQKSRNWLASKTSFVTTKTVPIAEHSRNSRNFSDSKHFVCLTCQKCVFNANHDACVTKFLNEVKSRAKVPSNKIMNKNKPVEQISVAKKLEIHIPKGHRFSIKKTTTMNEKTMTPRSCLRWKSTGKIFNTVGLRCVPAGKIFTSRTTKVQSKPTNSLDEGITNQYEYKQTFDVSAGTLNLSAGTSFNHKKEGLRVYSELRIHDHNNELSSSKLVPKVERFINYLEEQTDGEAMINSIKNGDQLLTRVSQVSIAGTSSTEQPLLKDKSMWSDQEKRIQKIDCLARSLLIQGLLNDIYSLIDSNKTAKDLWDALARHMLGSEYGKQARKDAVLYEYGTFTTKGELLLDAYIRYLQVINDLKKCGYSKDKCELNFKFLNNLQPEWKQYATMMTENKNLMDINIDSLYNILKQNQGDVNDAMGLKKKTVVVTS
nr:hypothetical protein [Tanacetum cinerariifolium]